MDEENDFKTMMHTPIKGNVHNKHSVLALNRLDLTALAEQGISMLAHLFEPDPRLNDPRTRHIDHPVRNNAWTGCMKTKIKDIQTRVSTAYKASRNHTGQKNFTEQGPTGLLARFNHPKRKFSKDIRKKNAEDFFQTFENSAPAYSTRRADGIPIPTTIKARKAAFTRVSRDKDMPTKLQAFNFEIGNRTIWTREKARKSGQLDDNGVLVSEICPQCTEEVENTVHIFVECTAFAELIWLELIQTYKDTLHRYPCFKDAGVFDITFNNIIYNEDIRGLTGSARKTATMLTQFAKWHIYQQKFVPRLTQHTLLKIMIHVKKIIACTLRYRNYAGLDSFLVTKLLEIQNKRIHRHTDITQ